MDPLTPILIVVLAYFIVKYALDTIENCIKAWADAKHRPYHHFPYEPQVKKGTDES